MRGLVSSLMVMLLAAVVAVPSASLGQEPAPPDGELVRVVNVIDGDTIRVERDDGSIERVRYIGIDTPELTNEEQEGPEPYSRQAALANASYVQYQEVLLETDTSDRDQFDRLLRYVWVETEDGWVMVNRRLVALGLATVRAYEPDTRNHESFLAVEERAKSTGRGMHDPNPISRGLVGAEAMAYLFFDAYDARDVPTLRRLMTGEVVYVLPDKQRFRGKRDVIDKFQAEWAELDPSIDIRSSIAQPEAAVLELTIAYGADASAGSESPSPNASPPAPVGSLEPLETPGVVASIEAVAVQRWPNDRLEHFRLYQDD